MSLINLLKKSEDKVWFGVSHEIEADFFSKLIERVQGTGYSHALAIYWSHDFQGFVVTNAHGASVQLDSLEEFELEAKIVRLWECDLDKDQRASFISRVIALDGIGYSFNQIIGIGIAKLFKLKKSPLGNGDAGMICSEYVDSLGVAVGLPSVSSIIGKGRELINPKDNVYAWEVLTQDMSAYRKRFREVGVRYGN